MLKTSQICCLWADSNSLIKKRHVYQSGDRKGVYNSVQIRELCNCTFHILCDNATPRLVVNDALLVEEIIMAGTAIISLMNVMWYEFQRSSSCEWEKL